MIPKNLPFLILLIFISIAIFGCNQGPKLDGYLWYGQDENIANLDLADLTITNPNLTMQCDQAGSEWTGKSFAFVCKSEKGNKINDFVISNEKLLPTAVDMDKKIFDPHLSIDGGRTLFRVRRTGDVFDVHLLFKGSGEGRIVRNVGAATFGPDNQSLFFGQGNLVASHVISDISHPEKMPQNGLIAMVKAPGTVRDIHFNLAARWLAICAGSQVLICDQSGGSLQTVLDTAVADLPGALQLPYRVRWSDDGTRLAVIISPDGETGRFLILDLKTRKHKLIKGVRPKVGGFAWTVSRPSLLK